MNRVAYIIKPGQTPRIVARMFTGSPERWKELLAANPKAPTMFITGGMGYSFQPAWWSVGRQIYLPKDWARETGVRGPLGAVGAGCDPSPVDPHPTAYYKVHGGQWYADVAVEFNQIVNGHGNWADLMGANAGWWKAGFFADNEGCKMLGWKDGILIRVPKEWLEGVPASQLKGLKALNNLYLEDGTTKWTPGAGGVGPTTGNCPTGQFTNPSTGTCAVPPSCPEGQIFDPNTWGCKAKSGGTGVGYGDEKSSGMPAWGWVALAAGAGIGAALLLSNLTKARHVPVVPATTPPASKPNDQVIVRR